MKSKRTRKLYSEGYWPRLSDQCGGGDRTRDPFGWGVAIRVEDRKDWYYNSSGPICDTRDEALAYVLKEIEHFVNQGAACSWAVNPIYHFTDEESEAFAVKYLRRK